MPIDRLRVIAFCVYLAAWVVLAVAAIAGAIPQRRHAGVSKRMSVPVILGTLLQATSALPITLFLKDGPLRPQFFELIGTLALAPLAAVLFSWAIRSAGSHAGSETLVTSGAYSWLRHPIYLAFLAMLLATGLLASASVQLVAAVILYITGSELRIAVEESELSGKFPAEYARYRLKTRWRYLPGLR